MQELREISKSQQDSGIHLSPCESNLFTWYARIEGPSGTPFEGGLFDVTMMIPSQYPLVPPTAKFKTRIFHPNVHFKTGEICLDILKTTWSPAWTLHAVCQAILALMSAPEPDSPLNCDAGNLLRMNDIRGYNSLAKMYTIEYAMRR